MHLFEAVRTGVHGDSHGAQITRRSRKKVPRRIRVAAGEDEGATRRDETRGALEFCILSAGGERPSSDLSIIVPVIGLPLVYRSKRSMPNGPFLRVASRKRTYFMWWSVCTMSEALSKL